MAFPDYPVTDDFNRADENPLSGGGLWDGPLRAADGRLKIVSNEVAHATAAGAAGNAYYTVPLVAPFQVWCEIPNASGDQGIDYCIQEPELTGEAQGYRWQSNGAFGLELYRIAEGAFTKVGSSITTHSIADGDALGVYLHSNGDHDLYIRNSGVWILLATYSDTGYSSGYPGIVITATAAARMDNFSAVQVPHGYPTFPSVSVLDDFNRANETPLSGGGNWGTPTTTGDPNLNLSSNKVIHATAATRSTGGWWTPQQYTPPFDVFATVGSDASNVGVDYCVQGPGTATPDGYRWGIHPGSVSPAPLEQGRHLRLYRFDNNVFTQILSGLSWGIEAKTGDQLGARLLADGTHLFFYKPVGGAWQFITSTTETTYTSGYAGIFVGFQAAGMSVDDFGIGAFVDQITGPVYKRFTGPAYLTGSVTTLYTCPSGRRARVLNLHMSNPTASGTNVFISIGVMGGDTSKQIFNDNVEADDLISDFTPYDLSAGEVIQAYANDIDTVNLTITGYEIPA